MRESLNERMYCPAIFEVAYNRNREVLERPLRFVDSKKVEQRLCAGWSAGWQVRNP